MTFSAKMRVWKLEFGNNNCETVHSPPVCHNNTSISNNSEYLAVSADPQVFSNPTGLATFQLHNENQATIGTTTHHEICNLIFEFDKLLGQDFLEHIQTTKTKNLLLILKQFF